MLIQSIIFVILTAGIIVLSWSSLRDPSSHGFYRFFAFEGILGLTMLNLPNWFEDPFSARQLSSWTLLILSLAVAVHGFYMLKKIGEPDGMIENTTRVVKLGAYSRIRHPLYASLLIFSWGVFFKSPSLLGGLLTCSIIAFMVATARVEEKENINRFGDEYLEYMETTKMFIPFLF